MPEERDIEKQLRAAAAQRRKDAGGKFELHPATHRLLQGEVARVRGQKSAAPRRSFWPRFAWGVSMLAILTVGVWVLVSPQRESKPTAPAKTKVAGYVQSAAPPVDRAQTLAESRADSAVAQAAAEPAPMPAAPAAVSPPVDWAADKLARSRGNGPGFAGKDLVAAKPPAAVAEMPAEIAAAGASSALLAPEKTASPDASGTGGGRQIFANAIAKKERDQFSTAEANVLNSFQLEQTGNQIRIVDSDGSVYSGSLLADLRDEAAREGSFLRAGEKQSAPAPTAPAKVPARNEQSALERNFRFAAVGTNLSLRQRVTINGEFVAATNVPGDSALNFQKVSDQQLKAKLQSGVWLSNGRVIGQAVTADGQAVELDAELIPMK